MLDKDDAEGLEAVHETSWVDSWEDALNLLDRYPWVESSVLIEVHPLFHAKVWAAIREREKKLGVQISVWKL